MEKKKRKTKRKNMAFISCLFWQAFCSMQFHRNCQRVYGRFNIFISIFLAHFKGQ